MEKTINNQLLSKLITIFGLILCSSIALAAPGKIQWHLYLIGIGVISSLIAYVMTSQKKNVENFGLKILIWGVYFWVVTFFQLTLLSILYVLM